MRYLALILLTLTFLKCSSSKDIEQNETNESEVEINPVVVTDSIEIEITGIAANRKGGAVVISGVDGTHYWIEGLDSWSDEFLNKKIKVVGQEFERNDMPVFLDTGELKMQGVPVYNEEEIESSSKRIWIINAKYELID